MSWWINKMRLLQRWIPFLRNSKCGGGLGGLGTCTQEKY
jgi:hypothetical protein